MKTPIKHWWVAPVLGGAIAVISALMALVMHLARPEALTTSAAATALCTPLSPTEKAIYETAESLWMDDSYTQALLKFDELTSVRPDYVNPYIIRGRIYLENLKQYEKAKIQFEMGLEQDPNNKYLLYDLGLTRYYLGDLRGAIESNQKALEQDPDLIIAVYNHAIYHVDYGERYEDESNYHKAAAMYMNVIVRDREFAVSAMFNLAALYARLAEEEEAESIKERYMKDAVELLNRAIQKEGVERFKKVVGEIVVPYGQDLSVLHSNPAYQAMIKEWKNRLTPE